MKIEIIRTDNIENETIGFNRGYVYPHTIPRSYRRINYVVEARNAISEDTIVAFVSHSTQKYVTLSDGQYVVMILTAEHSSWDEFQIVIGRLDNHIYDSFEHYADNEKWLIFETFVMMEKL